MIVGAYAAMPATRAEQEAFLDALAPIATGLEIPWRTDALDPDPAWLARQLAGRFTDSVVTAIPDTMRMLGSWPGFGLGSPDDAARTAALTQARQILGAVESLNDAAGGVVRRVELHSAPSHTADAGALVASLGDLLPEAERIGVEIVIEHCDARGRAGAGEKNFLSLEEEIEVTRQVGVKIALNWGRSVIESQDPGRPEAQAALLAEHGLLAGLMCSGAGGADTAYGAGWADTHLPLSVDEPSSLLTPRRVRDFIAAGGGTEDYRGVKIQVPADAGVEARVAMIARVAEAWAGLGRLIP